MLRLEANNNCYLKGQFQVEQDIKLIGNSIIDFPLNYSYIPITEEERLNHDSDVKFDGDKVKLNFLFEYICGYCLRESLTPFSQKLEKANAFICPYEGTFWQIVLEEGLDPITFLKSNIARINFIDRLGNYKDKLGQFRALKG